MIKILIQILAVPKEAGLDVGISVNGHQYYTPFIGLFE